MNYGLIWTLITISVILLVVEFITKKTILILFAGVGAVGAGIAFLVTPVWVPIVSVIVLGAVGYFVFRKIVKEEPVEEVVEVVDDGPVIEFFDTSGFPTDDV